MTTVSINDRALLSLDLSSIGSQIDRWLAISPRQFDLDLRFAIDYPQDPDDPRELSEIPEIRLWFIRLDARYPYLPLILDWQAGELSRYVAMLVPHQFNRKEGIQYNPEALEIWVMHRVFLLTNWLQTQQIPDRSRLKFMTQMLGYELDDGLFELLEGEE
ncbi:CRR6 family NdhI maturation factor [Chamaesiphon sp. VAR_48_metabat_135_sub]|uniref:CRR6 family NdhI maturation factor n=1 Tax=Chamaesiphon sp. VAR_48_metabat_135_sub TaxID=2964699 RepID=UPI00286C3162|nr:CRR6 family NdhI maturation factor [Chamaesiphon sp. VAR_48_metabat_135_sub]